MALVANSLCLRNAHFKVGGSRWADDVDSEHSEDDTDIQGHSSDGRLLVHPIVELKIPSADSSQAFDASTETEEASTETPPLRQRRPGSDASTEAEDTCDTKISSSDEDRTSVMTLREVAATGGGLSGLTTVMIRNIPPRYCQHGLMVELNRSGFVGSFDFFYLPLALRSKNNRGFCFMNFLEPELAEKFYRQYHGKFLRNFRNATTEPLLIVPADVQGFEASAQAIRASRHPQSAPLLLRALPNSLDSKETMSLEELACHAKCLELEPQHEHFQTPPPSLPRRTPEFSRTPVSSGPSAQRFCSSCGGERPPMGCFCPYCGCALTQ